MTQLGIKLLKWLFRRPLTVEESNTLTTFVLSQIGALPISDAIAEMGGELYVQGRAVDVDKVRQLRESARVALTNEALALVREKVAFAAVTAGVLNAETPAQMLFNRGAIWFGQQEQKVLEDLAQRESYIIE